MIAVALVVAALVRGCGVSSDAGDADPSPSTSTSVRHALGPGSWRGARTDADGRAIVVVFIGGRPYVEGDPCTIDYRGEVTESPTEVRVRIRAERPRTEEGVVACTMEGYTRAVRVPLSSPLGDRRLVDEDFERAQPVFDGSGLPEPGWLPDGLTFEDEEPGFGDGETPRSWRLVYLADRPPPTNDTCTPTRAGIAITEGDADLPARYPTNGGRALSTHDVRGNEARFFGETTHGGVWLSWVENGQGYVIASDPGCVGDTVATEDELVHVARELRPAR